VLVVCFGGGGGAWPWGAPLHPSLPCVEFPCEPRPADSWGVSPRGLHLSTVPRQNMCNSEHVVARRGENTHRFFPRAP